MAESTATPDMPTGGRAPLTLEEYATISAYLVHYPEERRADVLERLDVGEGELGDAGKRWRAEIKRGILDDDPGPGDTFNDAFVKTKRRLKQERQEIEAIRPLRPPVATAPAPPPPPAEAPAPPQPLAAPPLGALPLAAPPLGAAPPPVVPIAPAPPALVPPPPASADPRALIPEGMRHFKSLKGTELASDAAPKGPALPFHAAPEGARSPMAQPAPRDALVPKGMQGFKSISGTQVASAAAPTGAALPFAGAKGPPPAPPPLAPAHPVPAPSFSVEQYASLCVELEVDPARAGETLRRYRLTPDQKASLDAIWRDTMARSPDTRLAFGQAYTRFKAWRLQQPQR